MKKAYDKLTSGMYLVSAKADKEAGCIINTFEQVASTPELVLIALNKDNYTTKQIKKSQKFNVTVLKEAARAEIIQTFGFSSSEFTDKFQSFNKKYDLLNLPYITDDMVALFSVRVKEEIDAITHTIFLGEVSESVLLSDERPMSYAYYKEEKKGITPPKAPSYQKPKQISGYKCDVCGYIYRGETLPIDYICPICGEAKFTKITE